MTAAAVGDSLEARLGHDYRAVDWMALNSTIFRWVKLEKALMFVLVGLIVLVAAFNIIGILTMMVGERGREVGILLAMGAARSQIQRIFVFNGLWYGGIGTIGRKDQFSNRFLSEELKQQRTNAIAFPRQVGMYLARRITRMAVEDIGLADPQAQGICLEAWQTFERLGSPEGELALAQAVTYLALAPKSNAAYVAYKGARASAQKTGSEPPPKHILNAPTSMMKEQGYGEGYAYDHDTEDAFSGQNYFPDGMPRLSLYHPVERGFERDLKKRLEYFTRLREKRET